MLKKAWPACTHCDAAMLPSSTGAVSADLEVMNCTSTLASPGDTVEKGTGQQDAGRRVVWYQAATYPTAPWPRRSSVHCWRHWARVKREGKGVSGGNEGQGERRSTYGSTRKLAAVMRARASSAIMADEAAERESCSRGTHGVRYAHTHLARSHRRAHTWGGEWLTWSGDSPSVALGRTPHTITFQNLVARHQHWW